MSLPTNFFIGRGGGVGSLEFTVPNGAFMRVSSSAYFFDVDTETSSQVQGYTSSPSSRFQFDPVTNYMIQEGTTSATSRLYRWTGSVWDHFANSTNTPLDYNGRTGWYFDNKNYNMVRAGGSTNSTQIVNYQTNVNAGSTPSTINDTEDFSLYGDLGFIHYYGSTNTYQFAQGVSSGGMTSLSSPNGNDWSMSSYDARTNVKYIQPQNQNNVSIYRNNNCLGSLATGSSTYSMTTVNPGGGNSAQYNATLIGFDENTGSAKNAGYYYIAHPNSGGSGWARYAWGSGSGTSIGSNTGEAFKMTPVYSFVNDAYYLFCANCVLKIPHLGRGELGSSVTQINYGFSASAWRGPVSTSAQGSVSLVDRTAF